MKFKSFFLIASIILLAIINQYGNYYLDYSIEGKSNIKANILRYFLSSYWKDSVVNDSTSYLVQVVGNEISNKIVKIKTNAKTIYFIEPDYQSNTVGDYKFYVNESNESKSKIEIGMLIYPDSSSYVTLNKYSKNEIKRMSGLIKVDPSESILERGNKFFHAIIESDLESKVFNSTEKNINIDVSDDFRKIIDKDLSF